MTIDTMGYVVRKTYTKNGNRWTLSNVTDNPEWISRALLNDLYYRYIGHSCFIRKIVSDCYTLTVYYDNNVKCVYSKLEG